MKLVIVCMLLSAAAAAPSGQSLTFQDDGSYRFYYETGEEGGRHSRTEVRDPDGVVVGKYSYQDADGEIREVSYRADESGFVAEGDVGVKGAPKGRFPAVDDDQRREQEQTTEISTTPGEERPEETAKTVKRQPQADIKEDIQDLSLEQPAAADAQPEGFPPEFFLLHKFQGLRRLPEPTKKSATTTTQSPKSSSPTTTEPSAVSGEDEVPDQPATSTPQPEEFLNSFVPWNRFYGLSPSEWSTAMFHQPVYVFAYRHPNSYGYHYHF